MKVAPALRSRLKDLFEEGWELWDRFDCEVRHQEWHPFVHGDYEKILEAFLAQPSPTNGQSFLEWGSATGVVTIMADLLGYDSHGIELDTDLVREARALAERHGSGARFEAGSFLPSGYQWRPRNGDGRAGTIGHGESAYPRMGRPLDTFDLVYGFPWGGEEELMLDLMKRYGSRDARLLLHDQQGGIRCYRGGRLEPVDG